VILIEHVLCVSCLRSGPYTISCVRPLPVVDWTAVVTGWL